MTDHTPASWYVDITETFVRFYVFLAQQVDRCLDEANRESLSDEEFHRHFTDTADRMFQQVTSNRVVKEKVQQEYDRISSLVNAFCAKPDDASLRQELERERETLRIKMLVLSDLLAVFRSV